jgi:hypothetical protein
MTKQEVRQSKDKALEQIKTFLKSENVNAQFNDRSGNYYSQDKFIVTWNAYYKGMLCEYKIEKCDAFYSAYSGHSAIY